MDRPLRGLDRHCRVLSPGAEAGWGGAGRQQRVLEKVLREGASAEGESKQVKERLLRVRERQKRLGDEPAVKTKYLLSMRRTQ